MDTHKAEMEELIEVLNRKQFIDQVTLTNLDDWNLSDREKDFFKQYQPEKVLIIYGSLAPGRANYSAVEKIKGVWKEGVVKGKLENKGWGAALGYFGFVLSHDADVQEINAFILVSDDLVANWNRLDEFEGAGYKRILAKYKTLNGESGVGYIYGIA